MPRSRQVILVWVMPARLRSSSGKFPCSSSSSSKASTCSGLSCTRSRETAEHWCYNPYLSPVPLTVHHYGGAGYNTVTVILQHMLVLDTRHRWAVLRHAANDAKKVAVKAALEAKAVTEQIAPTPNPDPDPNPNPNPNPYPNPHANPIPNPNPNPNPNPIEPGD